MNRASLDSPPPPSATVPIPQDKKKSIVVDVQRLCPSPAPSDQQIQYWVSSTLIHNDINFGNVCVRLVSDTEIRSLNRIYRKQDKVTDVLAFPSDMNAIKTLLQNAPSISMDDWWLGDIVVCSTIACAQAKQWATSKEAHWAHLVVHATLHLIGMLHNSQEQQYAMEIMENQLLIQLGYPQPHRHSEFAK